MSTAIDTTAIDRRAKRDQARAKTALQALRLPADLRDQVEASIVEAQAEAEARVQAAAQA
jgi:hypothetical protein